MNGLSLTETDFCFSLLQKRIVLHQIVPKTCSHAVVTSALNMSISVMDQLVIFWHIYHWFKPLKLKNFILNIDCADGSDEPIGCVDPTMKRPSKCSGDNCNTMNTTSAICASPEFYRCGRNAYPFILFHFRI